MVEVDETKYYHCKYHTGLWRAGYWVFGAIERESGKCFLVEVPDRKANTLHAIIEEYILPGSNIISDELPEYQHINQIHNGIYYILLLTTRNTLSVQTTAKFTLRPSITVGCKPSIN